MGNNTFIRMKIPFYLTQLLALGQALKIGQN